MKHGLGIDLEDLDFEAIGKEMEVDEAAQAAVATDENLADCGEGGNDTPAT